MLSILIHEQAGRRIIFYPDDRHLRQYAVSYPTLISIEIWPDAASAENALRDGLVTWENDPDPPDRPAETHHHRAQVEGQYRQLSRRLFPHRVGSKAARFWWCVCSL